MTVVCVRVEHKIEKKHGVGRLIPLHTKGRYINLMTAALNMVAAVLVSITIYAMDGDDRSFSGCRNR
jgi:hypothetical protein